MLSLVRSPPAPESQTAQQDTENLNSTPADGFAVQNGQRCYYLGGEKQTGLLYIDGKAYIYDKNGKMLRSGWYQAGGNSYYLNDYGAGAVKCWRLGEDGKYRYLGADGTILTNTVTPDGYWVNSQGKKV